MSNLQFGIAPINWTNDDMPHLGADRTFEQMISEAALAGFTGTEVGRKFPEDPAVLKPMLDLRGIQIVSRWFSSCLCDQSYESNEQRFLEHLDFLEKMGATMINACEVTRCLFTEPLPMYSPKPLASEQEWERLCSGLNRLGKIASDRGIRLCFHHHMGTVVETIEETQRLMDHTDPGYVHLLLDTGHFMVAGMDPAEAARRFAGRIAYVHLKDIRPEIMQKVKDESLTFRQAVLEGCFTVPGDGCIDFPDIFKTLAAAGYEGWMTVEAEQNPDLANPFEYALKARNYLRELTESCQRDLLS